LPARAAYGETDVGVFERGRRARRLFLRDGEGRGKLIVTLDRRTDEVLSEEWFDLARDPVESTGHRPPAGADTWRKRLLLRWREARGLAGPAVGATLTPEEQSALGALGYVGE
jgi:hypothetical protein